MTDDQRPVSDEALERLLASRGAHAPDQRLYQDITARLATTRQIHRWWPLEMRSSSGSRSRLLLVAVGLLSAGAVGAVLVTGGRPIETSQVSPPPTLPAPIVSAAPTPTLDSSTSPSPAPSSSPSGGTACTTDNVLIVPGEAVDVTADPIIQRTRSAAAYLDAAFITALPDRGPGGVLWATSRGRFSDPVAIATITGQGINVLDVLDESSDGLTVLVRVGKLSPSGASPECTDLYAIRNRADEGQDLVERLTRSGQGQWVAGAALSPGGRRVAYVAGWDPRRTVIHDLDSGAEVTVPSCAGYGGPAPVRWSPSGAWVAVDCQDGTLQMVDPLGRSAAISPLLKGDLVGLGWDEGGLMLTAVLVPHADAEYLRTDALDLSTGKSTELGQSPLPGGSWANGSGVFSPDGSQLVARGYLDGAEEGTLYLISSAGGDPVPLPTSTQALSWSADGRFFLLEDRSHALPEVVAFDVDSASTTTLASLPDSYRSGFWRIPLVYPGG